jgi:ketosteroid isomerase-like protein
MTPDQLADIEAIRHAKHMYSWCYDGADIEGLLDLFTEDAVCEFGPYGTWRGKAELRENYAKNIAREGDPFSTIHAMANQVVRLNGDGTAHSRCFLLDIVMGAGDENPLRLLGIYDEDFRKEADGRWRISRSRIDFLWTANTGRVPATGLTQTLHAGS